MTRVEAALELCPDRTIWEQKPDGQWQCTCNPNCPENATYDELINPTPA